MPRLATSNPKTVAEPLVGAISPSRILISVLLPAPFDPTRPTTPGSISRVSPSSAVTPPPYRFVSEFVAMRLTARRVASAVDGSRSPRRMRLDREEASGSVGVQLRRPEPALGPQEDRGGDAPNATAGGTPGPSMSNGNERQRHGGQSQTGAGVAVGSRHLTG